MARAWVEANWKRDARGRFSGSSRSGRKARKAREKASTKTYRRNRRAQRKAQTRKDRADVRGAIRPGVAVAAWRKRKKRR